MTSRTHSITSVLFGQYLAEFGSVNVSVQGSKCAVTGRADCRRGRHVLERKRGVIKGYGVRSMRRLRETIAELDQNVLIRTGVWARVGYPDDVATQDIKVVKRHLDNFAQRFARAYPAGSFIWRIEFVRRKSGAWRGKYIPHFHLLVLGVGADIDGFRRWLASAWAGVIGTSDEHFYLDGVGVDCKRVYGTPGKLAMYVGKYMGKDVEAEVAAEVGWVGRFWGVVGRANLPLATETSTTLRGREYVHLRRLAASWLRRRGRSGRRYAKIIKRQPVGYGFTLMGMSSDGWRRMVDHAMELAGRGQLVGYRISEQWEVERRSRWLVDGQEVWERVAARG